MSDVTNLRQGVNKIVCTGVLAEKDIHEGKDNNGRTTLEGYISVKVDDINQVRFNIRVSAVKNDGTSNPAYENISKFNNDAKSIAEVGIESATKVDIRNGQLNPYHSTQSGRDVFGYRTSFISVYRGSEEDWNPTVTANIELYVKGIFPEMDKEGEETGRAIIKGVLATYNGVELVDLIVPSEDDFANKVLDGIIEVGQTYEFFADIINNRVEIVKEIPTILGKPRIDKSYDYKNELIVTGCSEPKPEGLAYDSDAIKLALQEREERIKESSNKTNNHSNQNNQNRPSGAASGRTPNW